MYLCKVCDKEFYSTVDCQAHQAEQHTDAAPGSCVYVHYQCPHCGVVYSHKVDCQNHALRDHGIQMASCQQRVNIS